LRRELAAVVDWDKASLGSPALDVAHMRVNLVLELGAGAAGAFAADCRRLRGEPLADLPYWDVADTLDLVFESAGMEAKVLRLEAHLESALEEWGR
jgi:aminoglycoside phosphotransferase (APT) family kinase protein